MMRIFIGMLVLFFNFNMDLDPGRLYLVPDFIGYFLLIAGFREIIVKETCETFRKALPYLAAAFAVTLLFFLVSLWDASGTPAVVLEIIGQILFYLIGWQTVIGIKEIGTSSDTMQLHANTLMIQWRYLFGLSLATYLIGILVTITGGSILATIVFVLMLVTLIMYIRFLFTFNKVRKAYK